jgi:hypothetical protein
MVKKPLTFDAFCNFSVSEKPGRRQRLFEFPGSVTAGLAENWMIDPSHDPAPHRYRR